ncbi:putative annexin A7 [Apostichopus japonicus]|uniref:Annexin n=1 Tax=Stichopus japonicus TaxID=307972 RepID=A0A2G8L5Z8_STIJA|nr:putative annexin A7 [Apostichopus japonicus]
MSTTPFNPSRAKLGMSTTQCNPLRAKLGMSTKLFNPSRAKLGMSTTPFSPSRAKLGTSTTPYNPLRAKLGMSTKPFNPSRAKLGMSTTQCNPLRAKLGMSTAPVNPSRAKLGPRTSYFLNSINIKKTMAALKPCVGEEPNFDKDADVVILRKAMKGMGTDETAIIDILTHRSNNQRQEIRKQYKTAYGRDLIADLKKELGGKLEMAVLGIMEPFPVYDAQCLKKAMKGVGTDESTLLEILCARNNAQIKAIKMAYKAAGLGDLEEDLQNEASGATKCLLTGLVQAGRDTEGEVDEEKAVTDATALFEAGEQTFGTDESEFQRILIADKSLEDSIRSEMSGSLQEAYLNIMSYAMNPVVYFANVINSALKGAGTNEVRLTRTLISRSEIDLGNIKDCYEETYGETLADAIRGDLRGDFERILLELIRE